MSLPGNLGLGEVDTYALVEAGGGRGLDVVSGGDPDVWLARTRPPTGTRLYGLVGPGTELSLVSDSGLSARLVRPGYHQIVVWDRSSTDGFRLRGPGVNESTTKAYTGVTYWDVYLKPHRRYVFSAVTSPSHRGRLMTRTR